MRRGVIVGDTAWPPSAPAPSPPARLPAFALPPLGPVLDRVESVGHARLPGALAAADRAMLLHELAVRPTWLVPPPSRRARQLVEQYVIPATGDAHPVTSALGRALGHAVRSGAAGRPAVPGAGAFAPTQAMYLRYRGDQAGIGPHRDGKGYVVLICVFTLQGRARFSVVADQRGDQVVDHWETSPGELCLLRAPGLGLRADGRPWHCVGRPRRPGGERISLVFRMSGRAGGGAVPALG